MGDPSRRCVCRPRFILSSACTSFGVFHCESVHAGLVLTSSSGTINYSVRDLGPASQGAASFRPGGELLSPVFGAPSIESTPRGPAHVFGPAPLIVGILPIAWGAWSWLGSARAELEATEADTRDHPT